MDWKLLFSTFGLIFLAELGDKTQLACMASASGSRSTWTVFLGGSLALVLSTFIAVFAGDALQKLVPPTMIRGAAGVLFLIFGTLFLYSAFTPEKVSATEPEAAVTGYVARIALDLAAVFEERAAEDYRALAEAATDEELRTLLLALAVAEDSHRQHLRELVADHAEADLAGVEPQAPVSSAWPEGICSAEAQAFLATALEHERATAAFYRKLEHDALLPSLKSVFAHLASEEEDHARRIEALRKD